MEGDHANLGRQREDHMEIADRQEVSLALGEPGARGRALALGTVPVTTAVIGDAPMAAVGAGLDVTAQRSRAAMLDRRHDLELVKAQMSGMRGPICRACRLENVGDLKGGPHPQPPGGAPSTENSASLSSGLVTARTVLVATCV